MRLRTFVSTLVRIQEIEIGTHLLQRDPDVRIVAHSRGIDILADGALEKVGALWHN